MVADIFSALIPICIDILSQALEAAVTGGDEATVVERERWSTERAELVTALNAMKAALIPYA